MSVISKVANTWNMCRMTREPFTLVLSKYLIYRLQGKSILASRGVTIYGLKNIETSGLLKIGMTYVGFMNHHDRTFLDINGRIKFGGDFSIGRGCRFDIGGNAVAEFGRGYVNPNVTFIIEHGIKCGNDCAISWGCQFLDEDFHRLLYEDKVEEHEKKSHDW